MKLELPDSTIKGPYEYFKNKDEMIEEGICSIFGRKGEEIVALNLKALEAGRSVVNK